MIPPAKFPQMHKLHNFPHKLKDIQYLICFLNRQHSDSKWICGIRDCNICYLIDCIYGLCQFFDDMLETFFRSLLTNSRTITPDGQMLASKTSSNKTDGTPILNDTISNISTCLCLFSIYLLNSQSAIYQLLKNLFSSHEYISPTRQILQPLYP